MSEVRKINLRVVDEHGVPADHLIEGDLSPDNLKKSINKIAEDYNRVVLYSRKDCEFCNKAKERLDTNNIGYVEYVIGESISRDEVKEMYPEAKLLPVVVVDKKYLGGYPELLDWIFPAKGD